MTTNPKSHLCDICELLRPMLKRFHKSPCSDCKSFARNFDFYIVATLFAKVKDQQNEIAGLRQQITGIHRWLTQDLEPRIEEATFTDLSETFSRSADLLELQM